MARMTARGKSARVVAELTAQDHGLSHRPVQAGGTDNQANVPNREPTSQPISHDNDTGSAANYDPNDDADDDGADDHVEDGIHDNAKVDPLDSRSMEDELDALVGRLNTDMLKLTMAKILPRAKEIQPEAPPGSEAGWRPERASYK